MEKGNSRFCFVLFFPPLASWFAGNYPEEQAALELTNSDIRESNFSYLWFSREALWIQYHLVYLLEVVLFCLPLAALLMLELHHFPPLGSPVYWCSNIMCESQIFKMVAKTNTWINQIKISMILSLFSHNKLSLS